VFDLIDMEGGKCWTRPMSPASTYNVHADQFLDAILTRALSLKNTDRYPDAIALLNDLNSWKPGKCETKSISSSSPDAHKSALGLAPGLAGTSPEDLIDKAIELSQDIGKLNEAADLLEQAINRNPDLRGKYEYQLKLWRRGLIL
jgi:serine/threonine-protein kinase